MLQSVLVAQAALVYNLNQICQLYDFSKKYIEYAEACFAFDDVMVHG